MKLPNLTENEIFALRSWRFNYRCAEDEMVDYCSCVGVEDLQELLGWSRRKKAEVLSSLQQKGLYEGKDYDSDGIYLTDEGIQAAFFLQGEVP